MIKKGQKWYREEDIADKYDSSRFTGGGKVLDHEEKEILLSLVNPKNKKILDIATGTGRFADALSEQGGSVIGIDASREMLMHNRAQCVQGDALNLPFEDKSFDITTSMRFFHLLKREDISSFISEVERITKHKFVFETLHPFSLRILYQWTLPQRSRLYSNSFLIDVFSDMPEVKDIEYHERFIFPYGIYQSLPIHLGKNMNDLDKSLSEKFEFLNSTVYWELFFNK